MTGDEVPDVRELISEVPVTLQNSHYSVAEALPYLPNVVNVACLHCRPAMELSPDLESFLRKGKNHYIYTNSFVVAQYVIAFLLHFSSFQCVSGISIIVYYDNMY